MIMDILFGIQFFFGVFFVYSGLFHTLRPELNLQPDAVEPRVAAAFHMALGGTLLLYPYL